MSARHVGLLAALAALWGASYLLIKYALEDLEPAVIVFVRTALAAGLLYAIVRVQGGPALEAIADVRRRPWMALGLGALAITVPFMLITVGELEVPSGLTAVLIAPASLFVALFAPFLDRSEMIRRRQAAGLVVGMLGVALVVGVESVQSLGELLAALGIVAAAACYALSSFVVKGQYAGRPAIATSFISVGAGALLTLPLALATLPDELPGVRASLSMLVLGFGGEGLAFAIFFLLIARVGPRRATLGR